MTLVNNANLDKINSMELVEEPKKNKKSHHQGRTWEWSAVTICTLIISGIFISAIVAIPLVLLPWPLNIIPLVVTGISAIYLAKLISSS